MANTILKQFSQALAEEYRATIGIPVPRKLAWYIFFAGIETMLKVLMALPIDEKGEQRLVVRGVGKFIISWQEPQQVDNKPSPRIDKLLAEGRKIPRFRWSPSDKLKDFVIETLTGYDRQGNPLTEDAAFSEDDEDGDLED